MKAILVIDVPVNDTIDFGHMDIRANIEVKAYNNLDFKTYELQHIKVEPLPQKQEQKDKEVYQFSDYKEGWNDCINEILGEQ